MNSKLRILHLSEAVGWSGGGAQLILLASGLKAGQHAVYIGCPAGGELYRRALESGIETFNFSPFQDYDILSAWRLKRFIDGHKIDVVHAHHPKSHAVALLAKCLCASGPALVVTRRVSHPMRRANPFSMFKYLSSKINAYTAVAASVKKILTDFGVGKEHVRVIYSGVDTTCFHPIAPDPAVVAELNTDLPVVGLIGNYSRDKGQHVLLDAAARVLNSGCNAVFVFTGRETDSRQLRAEAIAAGVPEENTRFLGFRIDIPKILSTLSVSVNAAIKGEALSGSIRESMAMRIPVLASDVGGNSEIVIDAGTGALFPPGDSVRLAELIIDRLQNPGQTRNMVEAGYKLVMENFTIEKSLERTISLYYDLLAQSAVC